LCTDNTYFSETSAPVELERARTIPGMDAEKEALLVAGGHAARFIRGDRSSV
jgi:hypothetical protein